MATFLLSKRLRICFDEPLRRRAWRRRYWVKGDGYRLGPVFVLVIQKPVVA